MNREDFDHALRAAASVLDESELLVIGSQAIHGSIGGELFEEAERSVEVDIAVFDDPDSAKADLIDGAIGEASMFHETFGFMQRGSARPPRRFPRAGRIGWSGTNRRWSPESWRGASNRTIYGSPRLSPIVPKTSSTAEPW